MGRASFGEKNIRLRNVFIFKLNNKGYLSKMESLRKKNLSHCLSINTVKIQTAWSITWCFYIQIILITNYNCIYVVGHSTAVFMHFSLLSIKLKSQMILVNRLLYLYNDNFLLKRPLAHLDSIWTGFAFWQQHIETFLCRNVLIQWDLINLSELDILWQKKKFCTRTDG